MGTALGKGWDRESKDLFSHDSGARISKTSYRGKLGWWFFPVDLDSPAVEHAPTDAGREEAFATSVNELSKPKPKPKAKVNPGRGKIAVTKGEEGEPGDGRQDADSDPDKEDADEEEKDED